MEPIVEIVDSRMYESRFKVQLDIPEGSTLSEADIDRVLKLSSWEEDPNNVEGFEGGRSVLIRREEPIQKGRISLAALQISGIGYKKWETDGSLGRYDDETPFLPPCDDNLMRNLTGTQMGTSYYEGCRERKNLPAYRALGTYLPDELREKVINTTKASRIPLEEMEVPHVEAYGWYEDLDNKEGLSGFIVMPAPDCKTQRLAGEIVKHFGSYEYTSGQEAVMAFYYIAASHITPIVGALRELHEKRHVHLQTHLGNAYLIDGTPFVVDWSTIKELGENREGNIRNRVVDLKRPADDYDRLFNMLFPETPSLMKSKISVLVRELVMEIYSGNPGEEIESIPLYDRTKSLIGKDPSDIEVMFQWMKDLGLEGFPAHRTKKISLVDLGLDEFPGERTSLLVAQKTQGTHVNQSKKIGPNEKCPCGSGKKYKKCCGAV